MLNDITRIADALYLNDTNSTVITDEDRYSEGYGEWFAHAEALAPLLEEMRNEGKGEAWHEGYDHAEKDHSGTGFWTKRLRNNPYPTSEK